MELKATVERITYQNEENGYTVLRALTENSRESFTVVGTMPGVNTGSVLLMQGEYFHDKKYGDQFRVTSWQETLPSGVKGIEKYLASGLIKGIGPVNARLIVKHFGRETLDVLDNYPERLSEVKGIGKKRVKMITESWNQQKDIRNLMMFLQENDISPTSAVKLYTEYGPAAIDVIKSNPYRLAEEIYGIGFRSADIIASKLGFDHNDILRIRSGVLYTMNTMASEGNVYASRDDLSERSAALLETEADTVLFAITAMCADGTLINDGERLYTPSYYECECDCAEMLAAVHLSSFDPDRKIPDVSSFKGRDGIEYDDVQKSAIEKALMGGVMILTGGPGTGKTTVTRGIIHSLRSMGKDILLAAPTGRAAKRMSEATGGDAKTIHRLLEYSPQEGFMKNEDEPLYGDVLIIDEASMIDLMLLRALLRAVPAGMQLIFVGDSDQLPSVGAGNVLNDLISSGAFTLVTLTRIYRQAAESAIIMNAHRINTGLLPDLGTRKDSDMFFIEEDDTEKIPQIITGLVRDRLPKYLDCSPLDIQVLSPMQRGDCGVVNLNRVLQEELNPNGMSLKRGETVFRLGDKVMQIRNDYDKDVYNGDIGIVTYINTEDRILSVRFDSHLVSYEQTDLEELVSAYAITVHKSQGSEYPAVVIPLTMSHYVMLQRNLLYTAVTRAKKLLVLVGQRKAVERAALNATAAKRNSWLDKRIKSEFEKRIKP